MNPHLPPPLSHLASLWLGTVFLILNTYLLPLHDALIQTLFAKLRPQHRVQQEAGRKLRALFSRNSIHLPGIAPHISLWTRR